MTRILDWGRKATVVGLASLLVVFGAIRPAHASTVFGCGDGWICFYNYESFNDAGGSWGKRISGAGNWNTCHTMPSSGLAVWPGGTAYNKATSVLVNNGGANTSQIYVKFYDNSSCSDIPLSVGVGPGGLDTSLWRLANYANPNASGTWNDAIGSFKVNDCPC